MKLSMSNKKMQGIYSISGIHMTTSNKSNLSISKITSSIVLKRRGNTQLLAVILKNKNNFAKATLSRLIKKKRRNGSRKRKKTFNRTKRKNRIKHQHAQKRHRHSLRLSKQIMSYLSGSMISFQM